MPRPKKQRLICGRPPFSCFKPNGISMPDLDKIQLLPEEFEALRLADLENMSQLAAAEQLGISRQTFGNIIASARFKVASCLVEGKALMLTETEVKKDKE